MITSFQPDLQGLKGKHLPQYRCGEIAAGTMCVVRTVSHPEQFVFSAQPPCHRLWDLPGNCPCPVLPPQHSFCLVPASQIRLQQEQGQKLAREGFIASSHGLTWLFSPDSAGRSPGDGLGGSQDPQRDGGVAGPGWHHIHLAHY